MVTKNNKGKTSISLFLIILTIIIDLLFLYFVKYHNQKLSLSEFSLSSIGNVLNLFFAALIIIGILIDHFTQRTVVKTKAFITFFWLTQFFLIAAYISTILTLPFKAIYLFGQNGDRLFIALLFILYGFSNFVLLFIIWLTVIKTKNLILLRSLTNSVLLMLMILILVFLYILKREAGIENSHIINKTNNIGVVLGAAVWSNNKPSPSLSARVDKAMDLYQRKNISRIYLTGSNAPGELAESEVALAYIKASGKNIPDVFIEKKTTSTDEQIEFIKNELLTDKQYNVFVISDGYHLVRILEIGKFQNINLKVVPSNLNQSFEKSIYNKVREALALTLFWFFAI